jgi:hypothetical protein
VQRPNRWRDARSTQVFGVRADNLSWLHGPELLLPSRGLLTSLFNKFPSSGRKVTPHQPQIGRQWRYACPNQRRFAKSSFSSVACLRTPKDVSGFHFRSDFHRLFLPVSVVSSVTRCDQQPAYEPQTAFPAFTFDLTFMFFPSLGFFLSSRIKAAFVPMLTTARLVI